MKALQKQVPLLGTVQLRDFANQQSKRLDTIQSILKRGQAALDKAKDDMTPFMTGGTRRVGTATIRTLNAADQALQGQVVAKQYEIRKNMATEYRDIFQKMVAAKTLSETYKERHWSKPQVLNRATTGQGLTDSMLRRAAYAQVFTQAGKAQLFDFGQLAVDTADPVLADSIYRAVASMPNDERPFAPAGLLELVPNAEYDEATQLLDGVVENYRQAKRGIDAFEGGRHGQVTQEQIEAGLRARDKDAPVDNFDPDDILDEAGGIREDALLRISSRVAR